MNNCWLPETSGFSHDAATIPWQRLSYEKHLRIFDNDRSTAIKHAINWVYSTPLFCKYADYYAAGAWAVLAHGFVCSLNGVPTSDWLYEDPQKWNVSMTEFDVRINRALQKFAAVTDMIVASKLSWWNSTGESWETDSTLLDCIAECRENRSEMKEVAAVISRWASTRKVLSSAGIKGIVEEKDVLFDVRRPDVWQPLRIRNEYRPRFLLKPYDRNFMDILTDGRISTLIRYWPDVKEIEHVFHDLRSFNMHSGQYHKQSMFLTGKPQKVFLKKEGFRETIIAIRDILDDPNTSKIWVPGFMNDEFLRQYVESCHKKGLEEFLASKTPSISEELHGDIMKEVNMMRSV